MKVYWLFLIVSLIVWYATAKKKQTLYSNRTYQLKIREHHVGMLVLFFSVLTFFCGLRSAVGDTGTYNQIFNAYPVGLENISWAEIETEKGFYLLSVLYKTYVSTDCQGWFFIWAFISCVATGYAFHKYTSDVGFSCYLFISTTLFTYLLNGMRQYIAVSVFFALSCWLEEKQFWKYLLLALLLSTIHTSALIMIPVYFMVQLRSWSVNTLILIGGAIIVAVGFDTFFPMVESALSGTDYSQYSDLLQNGSGSNVFRLIIAAVPLVLSFLCRKEIESTRDKQIMIATNMSVINFALYFVATFTSGITVGRLTVYFDVYNLILVPWLINNYPIMRERNTLKVCAVIGYLIFFYVQMVLAWNGLIYESNFLHIYV